MKIKVRIEKKALILLTTVIVLFSSFGFVFATGWSEGKPFHEILYVDFIDDISGGNIDVEDRVFVSSDFVTIGNSWGIGSSGICTAGADSPSSGGGGSDGPDDCWECAGCTECENYGWSDDCAEDVKCPNGYYVVGFQINEFCAGDFWGCDAYEFAVNCKRL